MDKNIDKFCELLQQEVDNHSIYVWGGNGQTYPTLCDKWIERYEKKNGADKVKAALDAFHRAQAKGYDKIRAFDCSGLGYYCLKQMGLQTTDLNANCFYSYCKKIKKEELCKGCFVFVLNSEGRATHIGYVVDDDLNVIEAQGRAYGVVKRPLSKGSWKAYGKPKYFDFTKKEEPKVEEPKQDKTLEERIAAFIAEGAKSTVDEVYNLLWER